LIVQDEYLQAKLFMLSKQHGLIYIHAQLFMSVVRSLVESIRGSPTFG